MEFLLVVWFLLLSLVLLRFSDYAEHWTNHDDEKQDANY